MSVPVPIARPDWRDASLDCEVERVALAPPLIGKASVPPTDAELLGDLAGCRVGSDAARDALARIVERHGGLVYSVALRMVSDQSLADDVFQATFLVLVRSVRRIRRSGALASWLHGTARNLARRAIQQRRRHTAQAVEVEMLPASQIDPLDQLRSSHEREVLDEELQNLAETDRAPLVLYYLEERSQREIAELLGISVAAVESRLKRAKQELRVRLVRRGVTLSVALAALSWGATAASAAPPVALISSTLSLSAAGGTASSLAVSTSTAASLAGKELIAMSTASKLTALVLGTAGTLTVGGAILFGAVIDGVVGPSKGSSTENQSAITTEVIDTTETSIAQSPSQVTDTPVEQKAADSAPEKPAGTPIDRFLQDDLDSSLVGDAQAIDSKMVRRIYLDLLGRTPTNQEIEEFQKDKEKGAVGRLVKRLLVQQKDGNNPNFHFIDLLLSHPEDGKVRLSGDSITVTGNSLDLDIGFRDSSPSPPRTGPLVASYRQLPEKELQIYRKLDEVLSMDFPDNPLREVIDYVAHASEIAVRLDESALTDAGLDPEIQIRFSGENRLADSLAMMLENINGTELGTYVEHGVLHITTVERLNQKTRLRIYDLSGEIENLAAALQDYAEKMNDKPECVTSLGDSLAIRASLKAHAELEEFIEGAIRLSEARKAAGKPQPVIPPPAPKPMPGVLGGSGGGTGSFGGGLGGTAPQNGGGGGGFF